MTVGELKKLLEPLDDNSTLYANDGYFSLFDIEEINNYSANGRHTEGEDIIYSIINLVDRRNMSGVESFVKQQGK